MKKIISTLALGALLSSSLYADMGRLEMGIGGWSYEPEGTLIYTDSGATATNTLTKTKDTSMYAWMLIKHPIPILPNLRLEYANIASDGVANGSFKDFVAPVNTATKIEMTQFDVIPYYNLLDNTFWTTLDLGIDLKVIQTDYLAKGVNYDGLVNADYKDSKDIIIPLAYARLRVEIPATNIGLETDVKYVTYDGSTVYDVRAKLDYTFDFIPVVQPALEVGYRVQKFDLKDSDDKTKLDMEFSGFYAGLMLRF